MKFILTILLTSLAGLVKPPHVKGCDISPLRQDPRRPWNIPAQASEGASEVSIRPGSGPFDVRDKDSNTVFRVECSTNPTNWATFWQSSKSNALNAANVSGAGTGRRTVEVDTNTSAPQLFLRTSAVN
jgi:hypothetical protein